MWYFLITVFYEKKKYFIYSCSWGVATPPEFWKGGLNRPLIFRKICVEILKGGLFCVKFLKVGLF